jgi:hypothetical protein
VDYAVFKAGLQKDYGEDVRSAFRVPRSARLVFEDAACPLAGLAPGRVTETINVKSDVESQKAPQRAERGTRNGV